MSALFANIRTNPDKVIVGNVTLPGCARRLGPIVPGIVLPIGNPGTTGTRGTTVTGTSVFGHRAIEEHPNTIARGSRIDTLRMTIAPGDGKLFTTHDHDAKKRSITHGITARFSGGKTFSGVVAEYLVDQEPCRSTSLSICT